ncbi:MAG: hypothetical protein H7Y20_15630 [Bryobacteraceae bacterium]|nr:hypothetical protein [Bryobacteraceae bacterium]
MNDTLVAVMAFFVFISAVALCIQAVMLIGMAKTARLLQQQVATVLPQAQSVIAKAEGLIATVNSILDENRRNIADVTAKASEIASKASEITSKANDIASKATEIASKATEVMEMGKAQMVKIDGVITDASDRAKVQLERAELVVDDTVGRVHQTVTSVHNGVLKPVRELQGLAAGMRAAVQHLLNGGRPSVADATHDDEMFIG